MELADCRDIWKPGLKHITNKKSLTFALGPSLIHSKRQDSVQGHEGGKMKGSIDLECWLGNEIHALRLGFTES